MTCSMHAIRKYSIRTGRDDLLKAKVELLEHLKHADRTDDLAEIVEEGYIITRYRKGDYFLTWNDSNIKEDVCAIVRDDVVVTVMTKDVFSLSYRKSKVGQDLRFSREVFSDGETESDDCR